VCSRIRIRHTIAAHLNIAIMINRARSGRTCCGTRICVIALKLRHKLMMRLCCILGVQCR
jgi:hypothetical protein